MTTRRAVGGDALGIDVGGSSVRAVRRTGTGPAIAGRELSRQTSLAQFLTLVGEVVTEVGDPDGPWAVAIPTYCREDGTLEECPSLPALSGTHLADELAAASGRVAPLVVPDVAAAGIAESRLGAGRGVDRFVCAVLGTGANASAVHGGVLVDTAFGCLGDAGHVLVEPDGPPCACGGRGCLEAVCSGAALRQVAESVGLRDAAALAAAAARGQVGAVAAWHRAGTALGRAISTWSCLLWPQVVAVAGGIAGAGDLLLAPARAELARVGPPYIVRDISIVPAELGERATALGALLVAERSTVPVTEPAGPATDRSGAAPREPATGR